MKELKLPHDIIYSIDDTRLINIDELNFATKSSDFDIPVLDDTLNAKKIAIATSDEFNTMIGYRYPFLQKLNYNNIVIAGGFCRSIILKQRAKDIDFSSMG